MKNKKYSSRKGTALGVVMLLMVALSMAILATSGYIQSAAQYESQAEAQFKATHAAEAAIEIDKGAIFNKADETRPKPPSLQDVTTACNLSTAPTSLYPASDGYTFISNIAVPIEKGKPVTTFGTTTNATKTYHYLAQVTANYTSPHKKAINATVTMQRAFTYQVTPLFQYAIFFGGQASDIDPSKGTANPGNGILELNPGQNLIVGGRVHSNGGGGSNSYSSFYYGSAGGSITFQGIVTSVNGSSNSVNPLDTNHGSVGNSVTFANGTPAVQPYTVKYIPFPCSTSSTATNQAGPIEFVRMPDTTVADPNSRDREYSNAGLKILVNSGTTDVTLPDKDKTTLHPRTKSCEATGHTANVNDCGFALFTRDGTLIPFFKASATTTYNDLYRLLDIDNNTKVTIPAMLGNNTSAPIRAILEFSKAGDRVKDFRQDNSSGGRLMYCVSIDVSRLTRAVDGQPVGTGVKLPSGSTGVTIPLSIPTASTDYSTAAGKDLWNGLIYVHDLSKSIAENTKGVMLTDGWFLPTTPEPDVAPGGGLTVVTDHAGYFVGDYNTGGNPPVNGGTATASPVATGYNKMPAAFMADAVTILSSAWTTGYNSISTLSSRPANSTTVNAAILSGNVPSNGGSPAYSGGVENFLRLIEDWSGDQLTYYGSMICLFPSQYASGPWGGGGVYGIPTRNWYYEPTFNNPNLLPPGTPNIVSFTNGEWVMGPGN